MALNGLFYLINNKNKYIYINRSQHEDGSLPLVTRHWADYPADIMYNFYLWNLTNPYEVSELKLLFF